MVHERRSLVQSPRKINARVPPKPMAADRARPEQHVARHARAATALRLVDFVAKGDTSELVRQRLRRAEERIAQLSGKILSLEAAPLLAVVRCG